jgi:hypothetical protein
MQNKINRVTKQVKAVEGSNNITEKQKKEAKKKRQ